MITETRYTLEARLANDALLDAMLDRDPNVLPSRLAILYSHMGTAPPPLTCLTYRLTTLTPERRFRPALPSLDPAVDAASPITDLRFDFESYTLKTSGAVHEAIFGRLMALLDNQAWLVLDAGGSPVGRVFKGECVTAQPNLYDDKLNAHLGLYSFLLRVIRTSSGRAAPGLPALPNSGSPAAPTPGLPAVRPTYGQPFTPPFTDGTHRAVVHFQASCYEYGGGFDGLGLVSGYAQSAENIAALGFDAIAFDTGGDNAPYPGNITNLFAGLALRNAANAGKVNALGVGDVKAYILFDMSTFPEDAGGQAAMASLFLAHCQHPAYFTYQGQPLFSTYVGEGGGWANVHTVFGAALAAIRAAGVSPFVLPGFIPSDASGTYIDRSNAASAAAWATGELKGFAGGGWQYPSGACPLGPGSGIPGDETCSAALAGIGLPYMRGVMPHYWGSAHGGSAGGTRYFEEFRGGEGMAAAMRSILRDTNAFMLQFATYNDFVEGSAISPVDPNVKWPELQHHEVIGYYCSKLGLGKEWQYWLTWYKTQQEPLVVDDTLIYYVRPQTAGCALTAPDPYGPITQVDNPDSDPPGVLQDLLFVTAIVKASGYVQADFLDPSGAVIAGASWTRFVAAGISHVAGPFVAGTPALTLRRDGQSVLSLTAPAIVSEAAEINANYRTGYASA